MSCSQKAPALSGAAMTVQPEGWLRGRPAQIRFAVRHGRRTQRQQGGVLSAQRLYAAQELCYGGGVCTEHADAWKVMYLHHGYLLTKKVSAKRV